MLYLMFLVFLASSLLLLCVLVGVDFGIICVMFSFGAVFVFLLALEVMARRVTDSWQLLVLLCFMFKFNFIKFAFLGFLWVRVVSLLLNWGYRLEYYCFCEDVGDCS